MDVFAAIIWVILGALFGFSQWAWAGSLLRRERAFFGSGHPSALAERLFTTFWGCMTAGISMLCLEIGLRRRQVCRARQGDIEIVHFDTRKRLFAAHLPSVPEWEESWHVGLEER